MIQLNETARDAISQALDYHVRSAEDARGRQRQVQTLVDNAAASATFHEQCAEELRQTLRAAGEQPVDPGHLPALS